MSDNHCHLVLSERLKHWLKRCVWEMEGDEQSLSRVGLLIWRRAQPGLQRNPDKRLVEQTWLRLLWILFSTRPHPCPILHHPILGRILLSQCRQNPIPWISDHPWCYLVKFLTLPSSPCWPLTTHGRLEGLPSWFSQNPLLALIFPLSNLPFTCTTTLTPAGPEMPLCSCCIWNRCQLYPEVLYCNHSWIKSLFFFFCHFSSPPPHPLKSVLTTLTTIQLC